jgi:hypothetical protein
MNTMSGPIVRKYGFPNHDKIFGTRPLEHGVDEDSQLSEGQAETPAPAKPKKPSAPKAKSSAPKKKA